ncbi:FAD/NAD(P)-binding protein [Dactylosporangium sp. AC04546]|uniref:FAD/NAD(P)-binding protein n=1 Tax=Dactylosporangium sp. AC04546 TaxID=2862460 RepID=UPI001EDD60A6|nr:FAD/NAD(P)-binding protein [Dactylosporangium sp. AC04546]WVK79082.1 FAD/NAD(P)-binding protein [Dactylosporangium sp. AC04546]
MTFTVAIVGAGPRGTGVLERLLANAGELLGGAPMRIELVDPYPPGGGRVWRADQPPLMWMNAMAEDVTMFPDETVRCAGPPRPGPSLSEWAAGEGAVAGLTGMSFASRRVQSRYLGWVFERLVAGRPPNVTVRVHPTLAVRLDTGPGGRQRVWLRDAPGCLAADVVVLSMGHLDNAPGEHEQAMAAFAGRHRLPYLPRAYSTDADLSAFGAGQVVAMRGLGLAFTDLMVLLTEGRGGRYRERRGELEYVPCGAEPVLLAGSRRGVPYRAKFTYRLPAPPAPLPRFFDADRVTGSLAGRSIDFQADLWPLIAKEVGWAYYHQLFAAHPGRTALPWAAFADGYAELDWYSPARRDLVAAAVPDPADRLDFEAYDRPLHGVSLPSLARLQEHLRGHLAADLRRRGDPAHSADLAAFHGLRSAYGQMADILATGRIHATSYVEDVRGWWQSFFEYYGSGPPAVRVRQLLALSRAGIVRFAGAGMRVHRDERGGVFRVAGDTAAGIATATGLIEARLPAGDVRTCTDRLLRDLCERGEAGEQLLVAADERPQRHGQLRVDADFRLIERDGRAHPQRFAVGPFTSVTYFGTFARPRSNALSFRQNDRIARSVLAVLRRQPAIVEGVSP